VQFTRQYLAQFSRKFCAFSPIILHNFLGGLTISVHTEYSVSILTFISVYYYVKPDMAVISSPAFGLSLTTTAKQW